jgi:hypothetical protein
MQYPLDKGKIIIGLRLHNHFNVSYNKTYSLIIFVYVFFSSYIFLGFLCVYRVPLPRLRGQHTVLCDPRWLPTSGLTEFAVCWGGAGFEPRTTDLQSGALPLSHLSSFVYVTASNQCH